LSPLILLVYQIHYHFDHGVFFFKNSCSEKPNNLIFFELFPFGKLLAFFLGSAKFAHGKNSFFVVDANFAPTSFITCIKRTLTTPRLPPLLEASGDA